MLVIFCEECGGKNIIDQKTLAQLKAGVIDCQICNSHISRETIISYSGSANRVDTKNIQLLFIDDESLFLETMQVSMKNDYSVHVALSGTEGILLAEQIVPDLIFLDVNMPGMNGYEVCTKLKKNKKLRHIPIIFVSAGTESDGERKGLSLGAVDFISKPIDLPIFHARVAMHIRLKKIQDAHQKEIWQYQDIITSMKKNSLQLEKALETSDRDILSLKNGLNTLDQLVILQGRDGKIRWTNEVTLKTFGLSMEEITDVSCYQLFCDSEEECLPCSLSQQDKSNNSWQTRTQFSSKLQAQVIHKHLPVFNDEGELLSQIHLAEIQSSTDSKKNRESGAAHKYITANLPEIRKLVTLLTISVDSITNIYKDDKRLSEFNSYITDSAHKLKTMLDELQKIKNDKHP